MSDADAFLAAIRANPADDTVRLVFADWLDDHGDPALAEFVRVQIRLGPANRNSPRVAALAARERQLLAAHRADWLGPLAGIDPTDGFAPKFARGFVDAVSAASELLADRSADIARHCPVLRCLDALAVRGVGAALASAACLAPVRTLRLEDWPYPDDAVALAASPYLRRVEELSVWVGSRHDESVVRAFAASPNLPNLRRVELVQLHGGLAAGDRAGELAARADRLAAEFDRVFGKSVAVVDRPFRELMPLAEDIGRNLYAGTLPDGRRALVYLGRGFDLFFFDEEGVLLGGERLDNTEIVRVRPRWPFTDYQWAEVMEFLRKRVGFTPGAIWVEEFDSEGVVPDSYLSVYKLGGDAVEITADPDAPTRWHSDDWFGTITTVLYFLRGGHFCINEGNECWADESGRIHTT